MQKLQIELPKKHFLLSDVEIEGYHVWLMEETFFYQPVKCKKKTYDNIQKVTNGWRNDYTIGFLLDYNCLKDHEKLIITELIKHQWLDADPKEYKQINFTGTLKANATLVYNFDEAKESVLDF